MLWKVLKSEEDYNKASIRLMEIFHAEPDTSEGDELVSSVLSGKREITLKMAQRLKDFFKIPAEVFLQSFLKI